MQLSTAVAEYVDHIRYERRLAKTTCKHYASWLRGFLLWCADNGYPDPDLSAFNPLTLRRYQMDKSKDGARPRTIHSAFHPLKGLAVYLVKRGLLAENPFREVEMPKKDAAVRHTLTDDNVAALFDACKRQRTARQVALYRAVLATLAYGGLRREECCDLRVDDVNLSEKSILVRSGKGSKSRKVFVCKDAVNALREWLALREPDCKHEYLFCLDKGRRMHFRGIHTLMATLAATAGMAGNEAAKPHSLRHWCASNLLRNWANLREVQQFLGHTDLRTTARYLHSGEEQLRAISELTALRSQPKPAPDDGKMIRFPQRREEAERPRLRRIAR